MHYMVGQAVLLQYDILILATGAGAFCAPLVATPFSNAKHWNYQYLASLGIAVVNTILLTIVFRFKTQDRMCSALLHAVQVDRAPVECLTEVGQKIIHTTEANHEDSKYRQIFALREVHLLAFFTLIYVGVEVTLGGMTLTSKYYTSFLYIDLCRLDGHLHCT